MSNVINMCDWLIARHDKKYPPKVEVIPESEVDSFCKEWLRAFNENVDAETRAELDLLDVQERDDVLHS